MHEENRLKKHNQKSEGFLRLQKMRKTLKLLKIEGNDLISGKY
jgi:hypothetical protein